MILVPRSHEVPDALLDEVRQKMAADPERIKRYKDFQKDVLKVDDSPPYAPSELEVLSRARQIFRPQEFQRILGEIVAQRPVELQQAIDKLPLDDKRRPVMTGGLGEERLVELCQQWRDELEEVLGGHISFGAGQGGLTSYALRQVHGYEWQIAYNCVTRHGRQRCQTVSPPAVS